MRQHKKVNILSLGHFRPFVHYIANQSSILSVRIRGKHMYEYVYTCCFTIKESICVRIGLYTVLVGSQRRLKKKTTKQISKAFVGKTIKRKLVKNKHFA